jgi:hypothetical protein
MKDDIRVIYPIDRSELRLHVEINSNKNNIGWKCLIGEDNKCWGEYIEYWRDSGKVSFIGFNIADQQVGIWIRYNKVGEIEQNFFFSFLEPGKHIDETEYKKQLAMIRLGIIKVPSLEIKISDYEK